jgi:hypothetical protein
MVIGENLSPNFLPGQGEGMKHARSVPTLLVACLERFCAVTNGFNNAGSPPAEGRECDSENYASPSPGFCTWLHSLLKLV